MSDQAIRKPSLEDWRRLCERPVHPAREEATRNLKVLGQNIDQSMSRIVGIETNCVVAEKTLPDPARQSEFVVASFSLDRFPGRIKLYMNLEDARRLTDVMCGGRPGGRAKDPEKPLGAIERRLVFALAEQISAVVPETFATLGLRALVISRDETKIERLEGGTGLLPSLLECAIACESFDARIFLAPPPECLGELCGTAPENHGTTAETQSWRKALGETIVSAVVALSARIETTISLGDLRAMRKGDVFDLGEPIRTEAILYAGTGPLFRCAVGQSDGRYTVGIADEIASNEATGRGQGVNKPSGGGSGDAQTSDEAPKGAGLDLQNSPISRIPLTLQVVLGSAHMSVRDMAALEPGGVIQLDRRVGETVELVINGNTIGFGELAVTEGEEPRFAVSVIRLVASR